VKLDQSSPAGSANRFQTTRWSVILVSAKSQAPGSWEAFADLCRPLNQRLRKRYTAFVREEISCTVSDAADVDSEIHDLCEALIAAGGRVME
jgi:hypothetical protein